MLDVPQIVANLHNPFKFEIYYIKSLSELKYIFKVRNLFLNFWVFSLNYLFYFFLEAIRKKKLATTFYKCLVRFNYRGYFIDLPSITDIHRIRGYFFFSGKSKSGMKKMYDKRREKKLQKVGYFCWFSFPNAYFALMVIQYIPLKTFCNNVLVFFYAV